jgi:alkyl sulfatase BDS1-like metallo-beta-lactamase superfamily hydrolase
VAAKKKAARAAPTPKQFFEVAVPRVLSIMRATCADLGGKYCVDVDGEGAWTLDFAAAKVVAGRADPADVVVHLTQAQFASLSTGKVELAKLAADGAARVEGDRGKIENVSLVLAFLERS